MSLRDKTIRGIFWVTAERFGLQGIQFFVILILARLLTPEDFGIIAMVLIFFDLGKTFVDSGLKQALIREKVITDEDRSTVFYFSLFMAILLYALLFILAPFIAQFFNENSLVLLIRIMGLSLIFDSFSLIQQADLSQRMNFKLQFYANLPAVLLSSTIAIYLAVTGFGVWSLASKFLLNSVFISLILWFLSPWIPRLVFKKDSFQRLFKFGINILIGSLIHKLFSHIYKIIIGKYFTAGVLGLYTQADNFNNVLSRNLVTGLQRVTYPALSKFQDDLEILKTNFKKLIQITSFFIIPSMIGLAVLAEPLILVSIGEKWRGSIPFLQALSFIGLIYHLNALNVNLLKVLGRSDLYLKTELFKKGVVIITIIVGVQFGIWGLVFGYVISSYIGLFINIYYTKKLIDYPVYDHITDISDTIVISILMGALVFLSVYFMESMILKLSVGVLAGAGVYFLCHHFASTGVYNYFRNILKFKLF